VPLDDAPPPTLAEAWQNASLDNLADALHDRDPYLPGHSFRVSARCRSMGEALGLAGESLNRLAMGALLHDFGKQQIPAAILQAPRWLLAEEQATVRAHAAQGASLLEAAGFQADITRVVRHHHERWDGEGYPDGLAGEDIPVAARIVAVADVWDALVTPRPHKRGLGRDVAVRVLREMGGAHLQPLLVELFLDLGLHEIVLATDSGSSTSRT